MTRATLFALLLTACGGSTAEPEPGAIASISLSPQAAVLVVGETQPYTVRAFDAEGSEVPVPGAAWRNDSPGVITLDDSGLATAIAPGYGQVTVTVSGLSTSVGLTVVTPEPE